jgi:hypothetical protein
LAGAVSLRTLPFRESGDPLLDLQTLEGFDSSVARGLLGALSPFRDTSDDLPVWLAKAGCGPHSPSL